MTYREAYRKAKSQEELIKMIRHDLLTWRLYGRNPDRLRNIERAMNEVAEEKKWDIATIQEEVDRV
jgi:hypothetical protein